MTQSVRRAQKAYIQKKPSVSVATVYTGYMFLCPWNLHQFGRQSPAVVVVVVVAVFDYQVFVTQKHFASLRFALMTYNLLKKQHHTGQGGVGMASPPVRFDTSLKELYGYLRLDCCSQGRHMTPPSWIFTDTFIWSVEAT